MESIEPARERIVIVTLRADLTYVGRLIELEPLRFRLGAIDPDAPKEAAAWFLRDAVVDWRGGY